MSIFEISRDPWRHTVDLLSHAADPNDVARACADSLNVGKRGRITAHAGRCNPRDVTIRLLERQGAATATIAWHDATRCSYGYQTWQVTRARHSGVCAMSGRVVRRGDEIFKPRLYRQQALNAGEMILASVLRTIEIDDIVRTEGPMRTRRLR